MSLTKPSSELGVGFYQDVRVGANIIWYNMGRMVNRDVVELYNIVTSEPEGPDHREARRLTRAYIREMSPDAVQRVWDRRAEIEERELEVFFMRKEVFMRLGFMEAEAGFFARCRLNSPGIRTLLKERVRITQYATAEEIKRINVGSRGTLKGLTKLYGEGGLYATRKTIRA